MRIRVRFLSEESCSFAESLLVFRPCVWPAKSKIVLKAAATGSVTKTFAQIFASDKLSLCRKVDSYLMCNA